jgi:iron complex outermembrane recepter protein
MKKPFFSNLFLLLFLLFGYSALNAQMNVTGTVKDNKGNPLQGAAVTVRETGQGTATDDKGVFSLIILQKNKVTIDVSFVGYASQARVVDSANANTSIDFVLADGNSSMGEVVVTASSSRRVQQVTPMSVTSLNENKLAKVKFNSQADVLRSIPGITAEGGGGEVAANIFIRGLPSGGQYQLTPLQMDGMPIISTMGLNSSAPDVYFRSDMGISNIEFVKGGASTLFGMGSVAGIINYSSKIGGPVQKTVIEGEFASPGKVRFDFNTGGSLNGSDNLFYNVSGTYRYDNGPIVTGLTTNGYQVRANIRKVFDKGHFTLYTQMIDDKVQFFLPYHLTADRERPKGWDGETINTMQTDDISNLSVKTPNGFYQSRGARGAATKGGYLMAAFQQRFGEGWQFDAKLRTAKYQHEFNFFGVDGSGRNPISQKTFVDSVAARPPVNATSYKYTYANDGTPLNPNSLILENNITDRNRPLNEMAGTFNLSKKIDGKKATHNFNIGTFLSRTEADDYNVQIRYLSEFRDQPKVINLSYVDGAGTSRNYTVNGVRAVPGYTNKKLSSNKAAAFITDEIVFDKLRIDAGFRVETINASVNAEKTTGALNGDGLNVVWGNGTFDKFNVTATDWAASIGASYQVIPRMNIYANASRGYFFPELRGLSVRYVGGLPAYPVYEPEIIKQAELGVKYGGKKLVGTFAVFTNTLDNRLNVQFLNVNGAIQEVANVLSSKSTGIEMSFDYEVVKYFRVDGGLTVMSSEYTEDDTAPANVGNWLERQPQFMYNFSVGYNNRKFDVLFHSDYYGKRYGNASNLVELDPYAIARLDLGYTFKLQDKSSFRVGLGAFNLFNSEGITEGNPRAGNTQTNTGEFFVGRPIIPRSYFARMTLNF